MTKRALQVELTKNKIDTIRNELEGKNSIFSNKAFLESLSLPSFIIGREKEAKEIIELLCSQGNYLIPFLSIVGRSGSGKTTITKKICESLSDNISYSFVNLRKSKTIFGCANLILSDLDEDPVKASEGFNKAIDRIETRIAEILKRDKKNHFVLVLDEFDVIFSDTRNNPSDFVYKLLTIVENLRVWQIWLCIVAISNSHLTSYQLDERILSRMDNHVINFAPYRENEILSILRDRAKKAFSSPISESVLRKCARISFEENGDCRRALQLLLKAAEHSKDGNLEIKDIDEITKKLNEEQCVKIIENATPHQRTLLAGFAKSILYSKKEEQSK